MPVWSNNPRRVIFPALLNKMNLLGEGVEIGVFLGWHSDLILKHWTGKKIYCIDPFTDDGNENWDKIHARAKDLLAAHGDRCEIWKIESHIAAKTVDDETLDWVYIDGRHDLAGVTEDIQDWLPKIKAGGVMAGHDYDLPDVKKAVNTQFREKAKVWSEIQTWYLLV